MKLLTLLKNIFKMKEDSTLKQILMFPLGVGAFLILFIVHCIDKYIFKYPKWLYLKKNHKTTETFKRYSSWWRD